MKSKKEEKELVKNPKRRNQPCKCQQQTITKMNRILQIQRPGIQLQLSTECSEETMDVLIEKAFRIINKTKSQDVNNG